MGRDASVGWQQSFVDLVASGRAVRVDDALTLT